MPFAPTFTEYAFPYSTGIGRPNMDATSGASEKYLSIMSLVGVVMGIYLLVWEILGDMDVLEVVGMIIIMVGGSLVQN